MMNLKEFIEKYRDKINNKKFEEVYGSADYKISYENIGKLTDLFYKFEVDPLKYMSKVPITYAYRSSIKSIVIPSNIVSIGNGAFKDCTSLTSVTIGDGVTNMGAYAFYGCISLKSITYRGSKNQWNMIDLGYSWGDGSSLEVIHCIDGDINL